ncbi:MAG: sigma-54 factor interaction domain-containing protein [Desulfobacteraceae bacterium]|nr:sigma-54 factor interaction domain-containing protein [Desulfobacteraceae bacterium]
MLHKIKDKSVTYIVAHAIHTASGCLESRFVGINCAGIPAGLLESELFGHIKGAFTGAENGRKENSHLLGTMLLDEIGCFSFYTCQF